MIGFCETKWNTRWEILRSTATRSNINFTYVWIFRKSRAFRIEKEIPLGIGNFSNFLVRIANCPWNVVESSSRRISDIVFLLRIFLSLHALIDPNSNLQRTMIEIEPIFHSIFNERNYCNIIRINVARSKSVNFAISTDNWYILSLSFFFLLNDDRK